MKEQCSHTLLTNDEVPLLWSQEWSSSRIIDHDYPTWVIRMIILKKSPTEECKQSYQNSRDALQDCGRSVNMRKTTGSEKLAKNPSPTLIATNVMHMTDSIRKKTTECTCDTCSSDSPSRQKLDVGPRRVHSPEEISDTQLQIMTRIPECQAGSRRASIGRITEGEWGLLISNSREKSSFSYA